MMQSVSGKQMNTEAEQFNMFGTVAKQRMFKSQQMGKFWRVL
jgi:hypothetical protein